MKVTKIVERKYMAEEFVAVVCDLCHKSFPQKWTKEPYTVKETEVRMKLGTNYPGSGSATIISFDICPQCFVDVLIPMLKEAGAEYTEIEIDY